MKKLLSKESRCLEIKYIAFSLLTHFLQNNNFSHLNSLTLSIEKVNKKVKSLVPDPCDTVAAKAFTLP